MDRASDEPKEMEDPEEKGMLKYIEMTNKNADAGAHALFKDGTQRRFREGR